MVNEHGPKFDEMSDTELDRLLASARWPDPDPRAEHRLANSFRSHRGTSHVRYWAVAAGILITFGVWGVWREVRRSPALLPARTIVRNQNRPANEPVLEAPEPAGVVGRPATGIELAMLRSAGRESRKTAAPAPDVATFVMWRAVLLAEKGSDDDAVGLLRRLDSRVLATRWPLLLSSAGSRRNAVARLIGATASADSLPLLVKLDASSVTRDDAVAGLARVAPAGLLVSLAKSHSDRSQRRQLIAALLRRDPSEMAGGFLELVRAPGTSEDALACLDEVRPPADAFFARLDDPHVAVRHAAAVVLGRIDGPQTTVRLIAMARRNRNRREALMALADSRGQEARQFLLTNQTSGPLAGPIRSVLLQQAQN